MTDSLNQQPMTRRERRLLEERTSQEAPLVPSNTVTPEVPISSEVQPPITPAVAPPAAAPAAPPLTRRERRLLESSGVESPAVVPTQEFTAPQPAVSGLGEETALTELLPSPDASIHEPSQVVSPEPLPPVFGVPLSTPPERSLSTGPNATQAPADFSPSRTVGSVSSATSSLILPHAPTVDIAGPLGDTGEIVVTGQIRLPSSLAERGSSPALVEDRDHDEVMDAYVTGAIAPTAKPMRASQAVSGKGDDTDIVLVRSARWGTATVVTGLAAGVLGLAALGLLVIAMLTDVVG